MFLNTRRHFDDMDRIFDSFFDEDNDFFSSFGRHDDFFLSREDQLKKSLSQLHNYENKVHHHIKTYENSIEQLKRTREQIEKKKNEINDKITKLAEEKKKELENPQNKDSSTTTTVDNKVFKRVHYKTPEMEIEEQYDSTNPQNCYKIIRKQGEAPQILNGSQMGSITHETEKLEPLGHGLDQKFEQLSRLTGKKTSKLRDLVLQNKESSVGMLYDMASEQNLL